MEIILSLIINVLLICFIGIKEILTKKEIEKFRIDLETIKLKNIRYSDK
jgi:hypothetical protein